MCSSRSDQFLGMTGESQALHTGSYRDRGKSAFTGFLLSCELFCKTERKPLEHREGGKKDLKGYNVWKGFVASGLEVPSVFFILSRQWENGLSATKAYLQC